jgi:hypothetical protein
MRRFDELRPEEQQTAEKVVYEALYDIVWGETLAKCRLRVPKPAPRWFATKSTLEREHEKTSLEFASGQMRNVDLSHLRMIARETAMAANYPAIDEMVVFLEGDPMNAAQIALGRQLDKKLAPCPKCYGQGMMRRGTGEGWEKCDRCDGTGSLA